MGKTEKQSNQKPIWPWVVGLVLTILLIIFLTRPFSEGDLPIELTEKNDTLLAIPPVVFDFIDYVGHPDTAKSQPFYNYTATALQKMASAISALAEANDSQALRISAYNTRAWALADKIKFEERLIYMDSLFILFDEGVEILKDIQSDNYKIKGNEIEDLKLYVSNLDSSVILNGPEFTIEKFYFEFSQIIKDGVAKY